MIGSLARFGGDKVKVEAFRWKAAADHRDGEAAAFGDGGPDAVLRGEFEAVSVAEDGAGDRPNWHLRFVEVQLVSDLTGRGSERSPVLDVDAPQIAIGELARDLPGPEVRHPV